MADIAPRYGPGHFQWNAGGWFGMLTGCTCWMLLGAVLLGQGDELLGWIWGGCFTVSLTTGIGLWRARDRLLPHPALQTMLAVLFLCSFAALLAADLRNRLAPLIPAAIPHPWLIYATLLIFPNLMLRFYFIERAARRRNVEALEEPQDQAMDRSHVESSYP